MQRQGFTLKSGIELMFRYNSLSGFVYKAPELCNYFCHSDCEEGQLYVPEVLEIQQTLEQLSIMIKESIAGGIAYRIVNDGVVVDGMFRFEKVKTA